MTQSILAAVTAGALSFIAVGLVAGVIHHLRYGQSRRYLWGVAVIAVLVAVYEYLNYLGR